MSEHAENGRILLEVKDLKKHFPIKRGMMSRTVGQVKAVDGVSFFVREGETLGPGRRERLGQDYHRPDDSARA